MKSEQAFPNVPLKEIPIAIVGLASMFPEATNLHQYWDNIIKEVDCIKDVPPSRWEIADYYDPDPTAPDKTYCKRGGFLPDIDFNPLEFGLPPNILEVTDVSQMLSLIVARDALHDAGYLSAADTIRDKTGVILGVGGGQKLLPTLSNRLQYPIWEKALKNSGLSDEETQKIVEKIKLAYIRWEENAFPGMLGNVIAGRIANRFDLGGINCVVDAACASSLGALKMAIGELTEGRADMMITGGVDTDNSILMYMSFSKTPAFSKSSHPRPFDAESDGMMIGEGIGILVLKRLADAERDGDRVYAVIKGIGASSDGRFKSIYAPRGAGQIKALERAYDDAGFSPSTVNVIEAHGTGTVVGDQTEVSALTEFFSRNNARHEHIALGSVKSQIGHTKAAAGAASLVKIALALHQRVLPATLHVKTPNPKYKIQESPFYINTETRPWIRPIDGPLRRAGVSSFGFGGTNYHTVLEEYPNSQPVKRLHRTAQTVLLHAATPADLLKQCETHLQAWQAEEGQAAFGAVVAASQTAEVPQGHARLGFVTDSINEAQQRLTQAIDRLRQTPDEAWQHPKGIYYRPQGVDSAGQVVALFPGQGSQYLNMGRELAVNFESVRHWYEQIDSRFTHDEQLALSKIVFPIPAFDKEIKQRQEDTLRLTQHAQPAIGMTSAGMYQLLQRAGFKADFAAGHSFGELTALWAAEVYDDETYLTLVRARGAAMAAPDDPDFEAGTMAAVSGKAALMAQLDDLDLEGVTIANYNAPDQVVIAGATAAINTAKSDLEQRGYKVTPLPVSAAFHTELVGHAQQPFAEVVEGISCQRPQIPVYANSTAKPYPVTAKPIKRTLSEQMIKSVQFQAQIEAIHEAGGRIFVEIGPRNVLTRLVSTILQDKPHTVISVNPSRKGNSDRQLREAALQLRILGLTMTTLDNEIEDWVEPLPQPKKQLMVQLSGHNYVSLKTQTLYQDRLIEPVVTRQTASASPAQTTGVNGSNGKHNGAAPSTAREVAVAQPVVGATNGQASKAAPVVAKTGSMAMSQASAQPTAIAAPASATFSTAEPPSSAPTPPPVSASVTESIVHAFANAQSESLKTHQQYLNNQAQYNKTFGQLTEQQTTILPELSSEALASLERTMSRFHDHQQDTLQAHYEYLSQQGEQTQQLMNLVVGVQHSSPSARQHVSTSARQPKLPQPVVAEAANGAQPAPAIAPPPSSAPPTPMVAPPQPVVATPAGAGSLSSPETGRVGRSATALAVANEEQQPSSTADLQGALLEIVSDKTGYPAEMIEMEMDLEADLGVDSIKRVEILGTMQDRFPNLPPVDQDTLSELRTLAQIVGQLGATSRSAVANEEQQLRQLDSSDLDAAPSSTADLQGALLEIVSDKTGYPAEMIEMEMDLEADLGIDSIKRVEILGGMQDRFPNLPQVDQDTLSELRTLTQIIDYLGDSSAPFPDPPAGGEIQTVAQADSLDISPPSIPPSGGEVSFSSVPPTDAEDRGGIKRQTVSLKQLPSPDFLETALPDGRVCVVTDDGTETSLALTDALVAQGWAVVLLSFPTSLIPTVAGRSAPSVPQVTLSDVSEERLQSQVAHIVEQYGPIGGFIHVNPALRDEAVETTLVKQIFLLAKHLKAQLTTPFETGQPVFATVLRLDGQLGLAQTAAYGTVSAGLLGLTKTLNQEWPQVFCRAVDVDPVLNAADAVQHVIAELHDPNLRLVEVAYGTQGRVTVVAS